MAYYVTDFKKPSIEYTAHCPASQYQSVDIFRDQVYTWLDQHNIEYTWAGHGVKVTRVSETYHLTVTIPDEQAALKFLLRWA